MGKLSISYITQDRCVASHLLQFSRLVAKNSNDFYHKSSIVTTIYTSISRNSLNLVNYLHFYSIFSNKRATKNNETKESSGLTAPDDVVFKLAR